MIAQYSQGRIWGEQNTMNTLPGVPKVAKSTRPVYKITITKYLIVREDPNKYSGVF